MRIVFPLLFSLLLCTSGRAQTIFEKADIKELREQLATTVNDDLLKLNLYTEIFNRVLIDSTEASDLLDTLKTLSQKIGTPQANGRYALHSSYYFDRYGSNAQAKAAVRLAVEKFSVAGDYKMLAKAYSRLGYYAYAERDFENTHRLAERELEAARTANDDAAIGAAYVNLAIGTRQTGNYAGAIAYDRKALTYLEQKGVSPQLISLLINLGGTYNASRNFKPDSAIFFIDRALKMIEAYGEPNPRLTGKAYAAMARTHARAKKLDEALASALIAYAHIKEGGAISDRYEIAFYLGNLHQRIGNYPKAKQYLYEAVNLVGQQENIDPTWLYYSLGDYYKELKDVDSTAHYFQQYAGAIAKAQARKRTNVIAELDAKFQNKEKQTEIDRLALEDQLNRAQIGRQNWIIGGSLTALGILGSFLYFLLQQRRRIQAQNETISEALEEKDTLLKEIHHRVKNNLQMVSSLLSLQSDYVEDDAALDALQMGQSRVRSMAIIHQKLYMRDEVSTAVSARDYLDQLIGELMQTLNVGGVNLQLQKNLVDIDLDIDRLIPLGLIANEVITNAMKYAFVNRNSGQLSIDFRRSGPDVELLIADDGPGLGQEFSDKTDSFGSLLIRTFAEQLEGSVTMDDSAGTQVRLRFPFE